MNSYKNILGRLVQFRKELGLTQDDMAEKLNISQEQYSYYENGKVKISADVLKQLSDLGLDINYFISGVYYDKICDNGLDVIFGKQKYSKQTKRMLVYILCLVTMNEGGKKGKYQRLLEYMQMHLEDFSMIAYIKDELGYAQIPLADELGLGIKKYRKLEKGQIYPDAELLYELYEKSKYPPILFLDICDRQEYAICLIWNELTNDQQRNVKEIISFIDKKIKK